MAGCDRALLAGLVGAALGLAGCDTARAHWWATRGTGATHGFSLCGLQPGDGLPAGVAVRPSSVAGDVWLKEGDGAVLADVERGRIERLEGVRGHVYAELDGRAVVGVGESYTAPELKSRLPGARLLGDRLTCSDGHGRLLRLALSERTSGVVQSIQLQPASPPLAHRKRLRP